jgi:hypothetical protein
MGADVSAALWSDRKWTEKPKRCAGPKIAELRGRWMAGVMGRFGIKA